MSFFGQVKLDGDVGPFFKYNHGCGPGWDQIAHNDAVQANRAYNEAIRILNIAKTKMGGWPSPELIAQEQKLESLKNEVLSAEPHQSFNCPDAGWYVSYALKIGKIASDISKIASKSSEPISTPEPVSAAPAPETAVSPGLEVKTKLDELKQLIEQKRQAKLAKVKALQSKQAKQAAYGRDVMQKKPKAAAYATESEKLIGGRTGYGDWDRKKSLVLLLIAAVAVFVVIRYL